MIRGPITASAESSGRSTASGIRWISRRSSAQAHPTFDRFGLLNIRCGGKYVTVYFDDLTYTARRPSNYKPVEHEQTITHVPYPPNGRKY